ncbi:MAG: hypothetical protein HYS17_02730 [Micavibrio aeruginosavorus]|uniref:Uncharacterized protein n=1 Tax=Micavibrio aeruginosavorus TaxID=349221 RepID=A0A7T5R382_9BACT|nr:MAG: hypothetical protein HYS17_02730 [Micavibrio aeruginosavorus]
MAGSLEAALIRPRRPLSRGFGHTPPPPDRKAEGRRDDGHVTDQRGLLKARTCQMQIRSHISSQL